MFIYFLLKQCFIVDFSWIQTRIICIEGEYGEPLDHDHDAAK